MSWEPLAAEAAGVCGHVEGEALCVACAAQVIELAVDVMTAGRVDDGPGRDVGMPKSERTRRIERAIEVLGAPVVQEDAHDEALRILRDEVPALLGELEGWRVDVGRLSVANTELGLALVEARSTTTLLERKLDRARRLIHGVGALASTMSATDDQAVAIAEFARAEVAAAAREGHSCSSCDAFGACPTGDDPTHPACPKYSPNEAGPDAAAVAP